MLVDKRVIVALCAALLCSGCAGSIQQWIVDTRIHQGDVALATGSVRDAELSYQLALRVDPSNMRARDGFVEAAGALAQDEYAKGDVEDALGTLAAALKYDPSNVRLAALKNAMEEAKLKREIVISNYPTYSEAGVQIARAYEQLSITNKAILASLKRFGYTYDASDLTQAIKRSYELQLDVAKNTNRLISYRQVVESGVPVTTRETTSSGAASLLPLP